MPLEIVLSQALENCTIRTEIRSFVGHARPQLFRYNMPEKEFFHRIDTIRRFNRFYTRTIGIIGKGFLNSPFSLTEARVLFEIAQRDKTNATELRGELSLDAGYMSRVLTRLQDAGLVSKETSESDARQLLLSLTDKGRSVLAELSAASREEISKWIAHLTAEDQDKLVHAMETIEQLLSPDKERRASYLLRPHQSGDMGWVVYRHGVLYRQQYGWNEEFEGLVAGIVSEFIRDYDPKTERCWIAEKDGRNVGSVFLVKHRERPGIARLRMLLVEPEVRGMGIGKRLVSECTRFARDAGYNGITLWTNSLLDSARKIYEKEGYRLMNEAAHHRFGHDLVDQTWELKL